LQINASDMSLMPYLPVFILPVIKSIQASQDIYPDSTDNRVMKTLAKLLQLLPVNLATMQRQENTRLKAASQEGLDFLKVFADNKIVHEYDLKIKIKAKLRDYQLEGINWMARLGQYNLNCALCDDMGLGKTLQSLAVVFNESIQQEGHVCSLIVCPTSLTYNWLAEVNKFFDNEQFTAVVVEGTTAQRQAIIRDRKADLLIMNYEKVNGVFDTLKEQKFFYLVLDEAHKIKNSKSKLTQNIKGLQAERKLVLTGTPLQNKVSELWSLFDFLMPDFLEEETTFNKTYNKYLTANIKKM